MLITLIYICGKKTEVKKMTGKSIYFTEDELTELEDFLIARGTALQYFKLSENRIKLNYSILKKVQNKLNE